ncbi:sensor histidine kinase [Bdellovibrio sp. HCB337]|uniref:sensor histidine kinase n=1 Tax=Bdellovibrio sp. HCB337 TaxID=3394358 RepID=UPI0039A5B63F
MAKYRKAGLVALWVYFVISTLTTFHEYANISVGKDLYLGIKIVLQIWLLFLCIWIKRDPYGIAPNLWVGIHVICSNIHGQYFSPWYVFSFVEMIVAYSFLFPLPRRYFNSLLVVGTAAFLSVSLYRYEEVSGWVYKSRSEDLWTTIVSASAIAWLCHNFFTADRSYREELVRKFGIIGVQAAGVVHDLKNMLAAPRMYVDLLKKKIAEPGHEELRGVVDALESQLMHINRAVSGLNQVVALQEQEKEVFEVRDVVMEVAETLNLSARQVRLEISGDTKIYSEKALIKSILFNIIMNSIQAFRRNKIVEPWIRVACEEAGFTICDNGGGFPDSILTSISRSRFQSFDGTGMGLFLVWNGVQSCGGDVIFSNTADGAQVYILMSSKEQMNSRLTWPSFLRS